MIIEQIAARFAARLSEAAAALEARLEAARAFWAAALAAPDARLAAGLLAAGAALAVLLLAWALGLRPLARRARAAEAEAIRLATARAVAETRAERIAALEQALAETRDARDAEARARIAAEAAREGAEREGEARAEELRRLGGEVERRFEALAQQALGRSQEDFLRLAGEHLTGHRHQAEAGLAAREKSIGALVAPIAESLSKVEARIGALETAREGAYQGVLAQVEALAEGQRRLTSETGRLVQALRAPKTRGRWGELQLRRVFEIAGMLEHVDFDLEHSLAEGALRPDAVVRLPGERALVVDAKTPLDAYLAALEAEDETARAAETARHARQLGAHVRALSAKSYWRALPVSPDFVVMFVPGEAFYAAALEQAPDLFEQAVRDRVLIATPTTLIALVKAVAHGWREARLARNAQEIADSARDLFERIRVMGERLDHLGAGLRQSVERYNAAIGSFEGRLIPTARRFERLGAATAGREVPAPAALDLAPRALAAPEITPPEGPPRAAE